MSPARARTQIARSGDERTNHEATAPSRVHVYELKTRGLGYEVGKNCVPNISKFRFFFGVK